MSEGKPFDPDHTLAIDPTEIVPQGDAVHHRIRASLVVIAGWEMGREIRLGESETVLGRAPDLTTPINAPSVSRQHAKIVCSGEDDRRTYEIVDLGSINRIKVNNQSVDSATLADGDKIQLGNVVLRFSLHDVVDSAFHEEVHRRIHYDELTGLLTMNTFLEKLGGEILRLSGQNGAVFTLAMTDLDGLKKVNDTHGHLCGRRAVQEMGAVIRSTLREGDRAGLYGGDEAVLVFAETPIGKASKVAEELRVAIETLELAGPTGTYRVTISQGLAEWPTHGMTPEQLIAAADGALYAAKGAGRNCVRLAEA